MRKFTVIALALLGVLLVATGGVVAHGNGASTHTDAPDNGTAAEWGTWMEQHMTDHMGADAAKQMQERMGMSYEEMGEHMASGENGSMKGGMGCH
jgi:hypothetical protein